jgi:hypothetical protein
MSSNPQKGGVVSLLVDTGPLKSRAGSNEIDILKLVLVCHENALWHPTSPWNDKPAVLEHAIGPASLRSIQVRGTVSQP